MGPDSGTASLVSLGHNRGASRLVQLRHLIEQAQKVLLPTLSLPAHLQPIRSDGEPTRHAARQLLHVEEALRIDANHDVVAFGHHASQSHPLASQLDPQRVSEVVELRRPRTVAILERPQDGVELLLVLGPRELTVSAQAQLLVANVGPWNEMVEG